MTFVKPLFSLPAFLEQTESWQIKWIGLVVECDYMMNGKVFSPVYKRRQGRIQSGGFIVYLGHRGCLGHALLIIDDTR